MHGPAAWTPTEMSMSEPRRCEIVKYKVVGTARPLAGMHCQRSGTQLMETDLELGVDGNLVRGTSTKSCHMNLHETTRDTMAANQLTGASSKTASVKQLETS